MKIKEHKLKLAAGRSKHSFEVADGADGFEEMIFEEYNLFDRGWV
ncbi:chlorohydrolase [Streptococcus pneumoniae]|nr:chlorohydrolase [Streptococcus pneumoniae]